MAGSLKEIQPKDNEFSVSKKKKMLTWTMWNVLKEIVKLTKEMFIFQKKI